MNVAKPRAQVRQRSLAASRGPGSLEQVSERSFANSRVRISDTVEEKEIKAEGKGFRTPRKGKTITKKDLSLIHI